MIDTRLFINGIELDLDKNVHFPLTYSLADIQEPNKRRRNSSKTIDLPGTRNNNLFFDSAYDLHLVDLETNVGFNFDPTVRYPARVIRSGVSIFIGSARLEKVTQKKGVNTFKIELYSEIANLFQALGDTKVSELGWSDYDETLSVANIVASWSNPVGSGIVWPYIDYGYASTPTVIKTNELFPFVYIKEIVEKCLEIGGLTVDSDWLDSARVSKMVFGSGGGEKITLTSSEVGDRQANYTGDGIISESIAYTPNFSGNIQYNSTFNYIISDISPITLTQVTDNLSQFDEATGGFTVHSSGSYRLNFDGTFPLTYAYAPSQTNEQYVINVIFEVFKNNIVVASDSQIINTSTAGTTNVVFAYQKDLELDTGDFLYSRIRIVTNGSSHTGTTAATLDIDLDLNNTLDWDFTALNEGIIDGDTVYVSRFLPNMKASDLMLDLVTAFNLYMGDKDSDGVVKLEPEPDFYLPTNNTDDWSEKIDRDDTIEIEPAQNIKGKNYLFEWAEDKDYYNNLYKEVYGIGYGNYNYEVPSTFKTGTKKYKLKIAQSIPVQLEGTDIVVPRILKQDENTLQTAPYKGKPRIFFYNGLYATTSTWDLVNSDTGAVSTQSSVPQVHHLDDIDSPTFDLNFGTPNWVYYSTTAYTNINLFNTYYSDFMRSLTGRDSKMLTAMFKLNGTDFYEGFMRKLKNIDGSVWRVNKVVDYDPNKTQTTKVELLKIVRAQSPATTSITYAPGNDALTPDIDGVDGGGDPDTGTAGGSTVNTAITNDKSMYIFDTSGGNVLATIDNDIVKKGKEFTIKKETAAGTVFIETVNTGVYTPTMDGETSIDLVSENDYLTLVFDGANYKIKGGVVGGKPFGGGIVTETETADFTVDDTVDIYYLDGSSAGIQVDLNSSTSDFIFKCTDATNRVYIDAGADTIDNGSSTVDLLTNESIRLRWDSTDSTYYIIN